MDAADAPKPISTQHHIPEDDDVILKLLELLPLYH
jgi:hypothetical protein